MCLYSVQPRRRNLHERHRPQGYLDSKGRSSGRCPRSADQTTKLGLPVLGTVPSVDGPVDQTWSTGAWDGALGQRTNRPNLVYRCLGRCPRSTDRSTKLGLPVLGTAPLCAGPGNLAEPSRAAKPPGLSASRNSWDISQNAGSWQFTLPKGPAQKTVPWDGALGRQSRRRPVVLPTKLKVA